MAISTADLAIIAHYALTNHLKKTTDQIKENRPFLSFLKSKKKQMLPGPAESENIIKDYGSNFTFGYGETAITFNDRDPTVQNSWVWARATDAFKVAHDKLVAAGIDVHEGRRGEFRTTANEKAIISNFLADNIYALKEGFDKSLDLALHRDGTATTNAVTGLDGIISLSPTTGTVGGIDRATATYWRNYADTTLTAATMKTKMQKAWRACIRNGGTPDFIMAGADFIDAYSDAITLSQNTEAGTAKKIDIATGTGTHTGLYYKGVEIIYNPTFDTLDTIETTASTPWSKRCYFINSNHLTYKDNGIDTVQPQRPHNVLALYEMIIWRGLLTCNRMNAHAVLGLTTT